MPPRRPRPQPPENITLAEAVLAAVDVAEPGTETTVITTDSGESTVITQPPLTVEKVETIVQPVLDMEEKLNRMAHVSRCLGPNLTNMFKSSPQHVIYRSMVGAKCRQQLPAELTTFEECLLWLYDHMKAQPLPDTYVSVQINHARIDIGVMQYRQTQSGPQNVNLSLRDIVHIAESYDTQSEFLEAVDEHIMEDMASEQAIEWTAADDCRYTGRESTDSQYEGCSRNNQRNENQNILQLLRDYAPEVYRQLSSE
jgi:hypothetical protein